MTVCLLMAHEGLAEKAQDLARAMSLDIQEYWRDSWHWRDLAKYLLAEKPELRAALLLEDKGLALLPLHTSVPIAPLYLDFDSAAWQRRLYHISAKNELAARALGLGLRKHEVYHVFDACGGLGQDAFVFAALGAWVSVCERSPLVFHLLQDALARASRVERLESIVSRIELGLQDARVAFQAFDRRVHAIYLDPMFPEIKRKAAAKKEMSLLQTLLGEGSDYDNEALLTDAIACMDASPSCTRVVLKRARLSSVLLEQRLGRQEKGKAARFDIYFRQSP